MQPPLLRRAILGEQASRAVERQGNRGREQMVVADGAEWIKTQARRHFPQATCILDWPHLWRTMLKAVRAVGRQREATPRWITRQRQALKTLLWHGQRAQAEALLAGWQAEGRGHASLPALTAALRSLNTQREWMGNYDQWKQQGYPVGSGVIERSIALVINRRMKRQGMCWLRRNATSVVALRVAVLNHAWPGQVAGSASALP